MPKRLQHITTILLLLLMVCSGKAWGQAWDGTIATAYAGGSGTEADPYIVSNGAELAYFASLDSKTYWVKITNDIDLGGRVWSLSKDKSFKGNLIGQKSDGTSPTISNYKFEVANAKGTYGLIGTFTGGGKMEGINVKDVTITYTAQLTAESPNVGALVGVFSGTSTMKNCSASNVNVTFLGGTKGSSLAGLVGQANGAGSTITNCSVNGVTVNSTGNITAGYIAGLVANVAQAVTISKCTVDGFTVNVDGNVSGGSTGGLVAVISSQKATVQDCSASNVSYTNQSSNEFKGANVGGLIGYTKGLSADWNASIKRNKVSTVTITLNGTLNASANVGGFIGWVYNYTTVDNAKATGVNIKLGGNITAGEIRIGGMIGYLDKWSKVTNCLLSGSNNKIETINNGLTFHDTHFINIGGVIGSTPTQNYDASSELKIENCVAYCDIDLSGYSPVTAGKYGKNNFSIGGVIGRLYKPADIPTTLYFSGKINSPNTVVAPLVGTFLVNKDADAYIYDDYSGMNSTPATAANYDKWYYGDYKIGISQDLITQVATDNKQINFDSSNSSVYSDGYLTVADNLTTVNSVGSANKESKTILWYNLHGTNTFNETQQAIYPKWSARAACPAYYMYYAQGVNRGNYSADLTAPLTALESTTASLGTGAYWTTADGQLSIGNFVASGTWNASNHKNYDVSVAQDDGTVPDLYYVWKVNGAEVATGATATIEADFAAKTATVEIYTNSSSATPISVLSVAIPHAEWIEIGADADAVPSGTGTEADPYLIATAKNLAWVARHVRDVATPTSVAGIEYYQLTADINLDGAWWTPIGGEKRLKPFYGVFDGNQKKISNMTVEWFGMNEAHSYGLFGVIGGLNNGKAEVKNLYIDNAQFKLADTYNKLFAEVEMGVIAGNVARFSTIKNIVITNTSITSDPSVQSDVNGQQFYVGGAIGRLSRLHNDNEPVPNFNIFNLYVDVDIDLNTKQTSNDNSPRYDVGGVIGNLRATVNASYRLPQSLYFTGSIKAPQAAVGPIYGIAANTNVATQSKTGCVWVEQFEGYPSVFNWTDHKYGEYRLHPNGGSDYITITDKSNLQQNTCTQTWSFVAQESTTEIVNYASAGKVQGVNSGEYESNLDNIATMFNTNTPLADLIRWEVDGSAIKMAMVNLIVKLADATEDESNTHTLSVTTNYPSSNYQYEWIANGETIHSGDETTININLGGSPKLVYVVAYEKDASTSTPSGTTDVVGLPRKPLTATYTPKRTGELNGADFDGVFTVTPDASVSAGYLMTYTWKEKSDDDQWVDLAAGTSATASADGKTCSTTGASKDKTYQCTITATDDIWQTFVDGLTESSPYYAARDMYSATLTHEIVVYFRDANVIFLHPAPDGNEEYGVPVGKDDWTAAEIGNGVIGDKLHPVRSWGKAYSLLDGSDGATWDDNIIVLVGKSDYQTTWGLGKISDRTAIPGQTNKVSYGYFENVSHYGLCNVFIRDNNDKTYGDNEVDHPKYEIYKEMIGLSPMGKNVTITGKYDGVDYNAMIESPQYCGRTGREFYNFYGNTKFEYLTFRGYTGDYDGFFAHYHDLWFGEGLIMKNFKFSDNDYGTIATINTPRMQVFGGMTGDARFNNQYDAANGLMDDKIVESMPNGEKGFTLTFRSGYYSVICSGSRQTSNVGLQGSPNRPIKCTIDVDIDQEWNLKDDHDKTMSGATLTTPYDIALILAGNHEGGMYADVDIKVKSGRIARIVNGSLGALRQTTFKYNGESKNYPKNTYMGRANILLDPASSTQTNSHITDINKRVIVTELYNGGVGRALGSDGEIDMPSLGKNTVTIKGGTIGFPDETANWKGLATLKAKVNTDIFPGLFGGGSGGMNGIGYGAVGDATHTKEPYLPYWAEPGKAVLYGNYATYISKTGVNHLTIKCYNTDTEDYTYIDPLETSSEITIEGGVLGTEEAPINLYGGGSGFTSTWFLKTDKSSYPCFQAGNIYGSSPEAIVSTVNIKGGTIYGNVYGAGRGTDFYYANYRTETTYWGQKENISKGYTNLGQTYGSVKVNITDNALIYGNVYGAGAGVAEAKFCKNDGTYGQFTETALVAGNTTLNISDNAQIKSYPYNGVTYGGNVYGGGMLAKVEGNTNVNISGNAQIAGSVFGAAQGISGKTGQQTMEGTMNTYYLYNAGNNKLFGIVENNTSVIITGNATIEGNVYGGGNNGEVHGTTRIQIGEECITE